MSSPDLIWQVISRTNCYIKRQRGAGRSFTMEPRNLLKVNSRHYSGLANGKYVDISIPLDKNKDWPANPSVRVEMTKSARNPGKIFRNKRRKTIDADAREMLKVVKSRIKSSFDKRTKRVALAKASRLYGIQERKIQEAAKSS